MSRYSKDRTSRFISIGPAISVGLPNENAGTTPANPGTTTGPGDECVYVPTNQQFPFSITWDVRTTSAGKGTDTYATRTVDLEASDDGTNWDTIDSNSDPIGGSRRVQSPAYKMFRGNIKELTAANGSPVTTVGITI